MKEEKKKQGLEREVTKGDQEKKTWVTLSVLQVHKGTDLMNLLTTV